MPKLSVFQVVLIERGKEARGDKDEVPDRLLTPDPVLVLATDAQQAAIKAVLDAKVDDVIIDSQRLEVLARPF